MHKQEPSEGNSFIRNSQPRNQRSHEQETQISEGLTGSRKTAMGKLITAPVKERVEHDKSNDRGPGENNP